MEKLYAEKHAIPLQDGGSRVHTCTGELNPWFSMNISGFAEQGLEADEVRQFPAGYVICAEPRSAVCFSGDLE